MRFFPARHFPFRIPGFRRRLGAVARRPFWSLDVDNIRRRDPLDRHEADDHRDGALPEENFRRSLARSTSYL